MRGICRLGRGALLAKFDLESAYCLVPVHPVDRHLLGVRWAGDVYVVTYGLTDGLHYLDDILILGPPGGYECGRNLRLCLGVCRLLGVTVAPHKTSPVPRRANASTRVGD